MSDNWQELSTVEGAAEVARRNGLTMLSIADMLLSHPTQALHRGKPLNECHQRNAHKPCSKCGKFPRHTRDGVCIATTCEACFKLAHKISNGKRPCTSTSK